MFSCMYLGHLIRENGCYDIELGYCYFSDKRLGITESGLQTGHTSLAQDAMLSIFVSA